MPYFWDRMQLSMMERAITLRLISRRGEAWSTIGMHTCDSGRVTREEKGQFFALCPFHILMLIIAYINP